MTGTATFFEAELEEYLAGLQREVDALRRANALDTLYEQIDRQVGIAGLKAWLEAPDWLIPALESFCYGETVEVRAKAGSILIRYLAGRAK